MKKNQPRMKRLLTAKRRIRALQGFPRHRVSLTNHRARLLLLKHLLRLRILNPAYTSSIKNLSSKWRSLIRQGMKEQQLRTKPRTQSRANHLAETITHAVTNPANTVYATIVQAVTNPANTVQATKRLIGSRFEDFALLRRMSSSRAHRLPT